MSRTIDERVVSMQFDNKNFESNVQTSLGTLNKLKQSLNLSGASKSLESINDTSKRMNFAPLSGAVDAIRVKFSALQVMGITALTRISNAAIDAGKKLVSAFTIDPIKTGFAEYETQIGAVQTILANTQHAGTNLDDVNLALDELNTYADKTIYNFTEMTRNIGTFTAAGVDLDKSVQSIKGIANLAAVSGSTSQQASTAMYQLSQALAAGRVSLMDWNSVVNAGMGGKLFQDALIRTSELLGTGAKEAIESYGTFRESLTKGQWLTTEVLTETLAQLSGAYSKADLIAQGFTEEQANEIANLADTAVNAATKVKTFTQLMDTLKESAQSGWTQSWEYIVGDFEQAKELWTSVSDTLGEMINASSESRNDLLKGALQSNWDKLVGEIENAGIEMSDFEANLSRIAKDKGYNLDALVKNYGSLEKVFKSGAMSTDILKESLMNFKKQAEDIDFSSITRDIKKGMRGDDVKEVQKALKQLGYDLGKSGKNKDGIDGIFGNTTSSLIKKFQEEKGLEVTGIVDEKTLAALNDATSSVVKLYSWVSKLADGITELGGRELLMQGFKNAFEGIMNIINPVKEAFREIFPPMTSEQLFNFIEGFENLTSKFAEWTSGSADKIKSTFKGLFSVFDIGWTFVKDLAGGIVKLLSNFTGLADGVLGATSSIGDWLSGLRDSIKEGDVFGKVIDSIVNFVQKGINGIKEFGSFLKSKFKMPGLDGIFSVMSSIWDVITKIGNKISQVGSAIGKALSTAFRSGDIENFINIVNGGLITGILLGIKNFFSDVGEGFGVFEGVGDILSGVVGILDGVKDSLVAWQQNIKAGTLLKIAIAVGILAASLAVLAAINPEQLAGALGAISVLFVELMGSISIMSHMNLKGLTGVGKTIGMMIGMSVAILILASALKKISDIDPEGLVGGLIGIAVLAGVMVMAAKAMASGGSGAMKGATQLVMFAVAIKLLASACKDLSSLSFGELATGLIGVGVLMAAVSIFANNTKSSKGMLGVATGVVILSAGIKILASACKDFASMSVGDLVKGLASIGALLLALAAFSRLTSSSKHVVSTGASLLLIAASMKIFASAVSDFGSMSWEGIGKGLSGLAGTLLALTLALNFMPKNIIGIGLGLVVVSASLVILADALGKMGGMSWDGIARGLVVLGGSVLILAIGLNAMTGALGGAAALIVASAAIAMLTPALQALGSLSWGDILRGLVTLAGAFAVIGVAGLLLTPIVPSILALAGAFALIGVAVLGIGVGLGAAAVGLTALATAGAAGATAIVAALTIIVTGVAELIPVLAQKFGEAIVAFCGAIGSSAGAIGQAIVDVLVAALTTIETIIPELIDFVFNVLVGIIDGVASRVPELVGSVINLLTSILTSVTDALFSLSPSVLAKSAIGLGMIVALMGLFNLIAPLVPGAMIGVLGVAAFIAEIGLVLAAFGALAQIPGLQWLIDEGGSFIESIGKAIGSFIGGIVGGIAKGLTSSLPDIGTNLSNFMTNIQPFIEGAKGIDASAFSGVDALANIILKLTAANILEGLTSWFTGGSSITKFANDLSELGTAIVDLSSTISILSEGDLLKISSLASIAEALVGVANKVPPTGGLLQAITGTPDLVTFAGSLKDLGVGISDFTTAVSEVTEGDITKMSSIGSAIDTFATIANKVPATGGLTQAITGTPDLVSFAGGLQSLGTSISAFTTSVSEVTADDVTKITSIGGAIDTFVTIAGKVPATGGLAQAITGTPDLVNFAGGLQSLGTSISAFTTSVSEVTTEDATKMSSIGTAIDTFVTIANKVPATGGLAQAIAGTPDLVTFATSLQNIGISIGTFTTSVSEVTTDDVTKTSSIGTAIDKFVEVAGKVPPTGGLAQAISGAPSLATFATELVPLGTAIATFNTSVTEVSEADANKISSIGIAVEKLVAVASSLKGYNSSEWFNTNLSEFATEMIAFGGKIKEYAGVVDGIDLTSSIGITARARSLFTLATDISKNEYAISSLNLFGTYLVQFGSDIASFFNSISGVDATSFSSIASGLVDLSSISTTNADSLQSFIDSLGGVGTEGVNKFASAFSDSTPTVVNAVVSMISSVASGVLANAFVLSNAFISVATSCVNAIISSNVYGSMRSVGSYMVMGFARGITASTFMAAAAAAAMAAAAIAAAKAALSINSPSRVFKKIGMGVPEGFAMGVGMLSSRIDNSVTSMADTAINGTKKAISRMTDVINTDIDSSPTIRPVMDLSDVTLGARRINDMLGFNPSMRVMSDIGAINGHMTNSTRYDTNNDVVSAIKDLGRNMGKSGDTYNFNGITYDGNNELVDAVKTIVRFARMERRS